MEVLCAILSSLQLRCSWWIDTVGIYKLWTKLHFTLQFHCTSMVHQSTSQTNSQVSRLSNWYTMEEQSLFGTALIQSWVLLWTVCFQTSQSKFTLPCSHNHRSGNEYIASIVVPFNATETEFTVKCNWLFQYKFSATFVWVNQTGMSSGSNITNQHLYCGRRKETLCFQLRYLHTAQEQYWLLSCLLR